jgi:riboflavin synthase
MFTGLVQGVAEVVANKLTRNKSRLEVFFKKPLSRVVLGESIALNGCCLTVTQKKNKSLFFDVSDETLRKTSLGSLKKGSLVNYERALKVGDRLGGHFVLGHVDGLAQLTRIKNTGGSIEFDLALPKQLFKFIIDKGSLAIDGISLTVSRLPKNTVRVYVIAHTLAVTHLGSLQVGDSVNVEVDMLGKYVYSLLKGSR